MAEMRVLPEGGNARGSAYRSPWIAGHGGKRGKECL